MEMWVARPTDLPTLARLASSRKYWGAMGVTNSSATDAEYTREVANLNLCSKCHTCAALCDRMRHVAAIGRSNGEGSHQERGSTQGVDEFRGEVECIGQR